MKEIWLSVKDYEGFYEVSNLGNVRSLKAPGRGNHCGRILKPAIVDGYCVVHLSVNGKVHNRYVARLVATAFIPNPENKPTVNHKNGRDRLNNNIENLEWATVSENTQHAYDTGLNSRYKPPMSEETRMKLKKSRKQLAIVRSLIDGRFEKGTNQRIY
jgi:hypothetical protein